MRPRAFGCWTVSRFSRQTSPVCVSACLCRVFSHICCSAEQWLRASRWSARDQKRCTPLHFHSNSVCARVQADKKGRQAEESKSNVRGHNGWREEIALPRVVTLLVLAIAVFLGYPPKPPCCHHGHTHINARQHTAHTHTRGKVCKWQREDELRGKLLPCCSCKGHGAGALGVLQRRSGGAQEDIKTPTLLGTAPR